MIRQYLKNKCGNVAMMTGLMVIVIFVVGGGAVDFIRMTTARAEMQAAVDSAVLAAASLTNNRPPIAVANDYFEKNFDGSRFDLDNVRFNPVIEQNKAFLKEVRATATADMPTYFIGLLDILTGGGDNSLKTLALEISGKAAESEQFLEIALVLDVSGSMAGARISNLQTAGEDFINKIFDDTVPNQVSVSIVPFSSNVNLGGLYADFADTSVTGNTPAKPCTFYDDADYTSLDFSNQLAPVNQGTPNNKDTIENDRSRCTTAEAIFNSDNRTALVDTVRNFVAAGRTDAHIGLMWGAKALSPDLRGDLAGDFNDRPKNYSQRTVKALVVMTDGDINPIPLLDGSVPIGPATEDFGDLCTEAKNNNIIVYSIGFDITANSAADVMLRDCASTLSQYYFVEGLDVASAFDGIVASILALRITD
ncbi:MAG: TadE/TadG family type IV pilus assembly protein [Pseudomonadota bacterium]